MKSFELPIFIFAALALASRLENVYAADGEPPEDSAGDSPENENQDESTPDGPTTAPKEFEIGEKSSLDTRSYKGMILQNNLKVLLIRDPAATTKFVSLSVGVGSFNDPKELPGLSNLLGSMILLGSDEYPTNLAAGMVTATETQTFSFEVQETDDFYYYQLEVFARALIQPLLEKASETALRDSIALQSANAELLRLVDKDPWVIHQIERMLGNKDHPNSNFSQTNQEILRGYPGPLYNKDLLDAASESTISKELRLFFNKWYSANIMTLVAMGNDSLEDIEREIQTIFGEISDKEVRRPEYKDVDYVKHPGELQRKILIVPQNDINCIRIFFPTPDVQQQYKKAPVRYVSHLLSQEGPGSLIAALRKRKLCDDLKTAYETGANLGIFNISCFLTEEGLKATDQVIELIFQYINMVKDIGVMKYIFDELTHMDQADFVYKESSESPLLYVQELANALHNYSYKDILSYKYLHPEWDEDLIRDFLSYLRPDNMNISIVSKFFEGKTNETEKFFETNYKIEKINDGDISKWSDKKYPDEFWPPSENVFLPKDFTLYPTSTDEPSRPRLIQDSHVSQIWFKPDISFKTPKLHVYLQFYSPITRLDPSYRCYLEIYMKILNSSLNEELHSARVAGLDWSLIVTHYGITVDVYGYSEKLPKLLERIVEKFTGYAKELSLYEQRFLETKQEFKDDLTVRGVKTKPPTDHGWEYLTFLLSESGWTDEDLLIILEPLTYPDFAEFLPDLMENLYIQGLIHGNCTQETAEKIIQMLEKPFEKIYGLLPQQLLPERTVKLNEKSHTAFVAANTNPGVHAHYSYYQLNSKSIRDTVTSNMMVHVLEGSGQTALGDVRMHSCGDLSMSGVEGFYLMASSEEKNSHELDKMAEEYIKKIPEALISMSEEEFEKAKELLISKKSQEPNSPRLMTQKYWMEIMNRTLHFDRKEDEIKEVRSLKKADLLSFHKKYLDPSSNSRSKLAVHIVPKADPPLPLTAPPSVSKIENITIFKSSLKLLPLPRSVISSNTPGNMSKLRKPLSSFEDSDEEKETEEGTSSAAPEEAASSSKGKATRASTSGGKGRRRRTARASR